MILSSAQLFSQGFNWQYDIRFPTKSEKLFLGLSTSKLFSTGVSDISFSELYIPCCNFKNSESNGFTFGINAEYWLNNGINAITFRINYNKSRFNLRANPDPIYYKNDTLFTEIINNNTINYLDLSGLYKYRIFDSHFSISAGANINILLSNIYKVQENVTSPGDTFNNGETSREIINGSTKDLSRIIINPILRAGYDFSIANGLYTSVYTDFGVNINSLIKYDNWRNFQFSVGIAFYFGTY